MPQPVVRRNIDGEPVEKRCGRKTGVEQDERCETYVDLDVVYCAPHQDEFNELEQAVVTAQNNLETALGSVETAQSDLNLATAQTAEQEANEARIAADEALAEANEALANAQTALDEATQALSSWEFFNVTKTY